ncbi:MAG: ABC transporter ATP-binding protein [Methanospirillum sp.]|nr:ABC transporter ATP-binding protein [Methanospirillum sp.]
MLKIPTGQADAADTLRRPEGDPSLFIRPFTLPWKQEKDKESPIIAFRQVTKIYPLDSGDVTGIDNVSLDIFPGEFIAVMGPSGSGKSTLLNLMGCLDQPSSGEILIEGNSVRMMSDNQLTDLRLELLGFIFQYFNLFPLFDALKNVHYPYATRTGRIYDTSRAKEALREVDLPEPFWTHRPGQLSGGQQQRVAIARALVNDPSILLCDEPTGNLDTHTGTTILNLLSDLSRREGRTIVMVTHDPKTAEYADRIIRIVDGKVAGEKG